MNDRECYEHIRMSDINEDKRQKTLLLLYVGEYTFDMYENFTGAQKGEDATITVGERDIAEVFPNEYHTDAKCCI